MRRYKPDMHSHTRIHSRTHAFTHAHTLTYTRTHAYTLTQKQMIIVNAGNKYLCINVEPENQHMLLRLLPFLLHFPCYECLLIFAFASLFWVSVLNSRLSRSLKHNFWILYGSSKISQQWHSEPDSGSQVHHSV